MIGDLLMFTSVVFTYVYVGGTYFVHSTQLFSVVLGSDTVPEIRPTHRLGR